MYQKRSAWILTGVAPNRGAATRLADIELAVQTEIPLVKQHLCDVLWAARGQARTPSGTIASPGARAHRSALRARPPSPTASPWSPASSPAHARSWPPSTRRSCGRRSARPRPARPSASRTSTSPRAASSTSCWRATTASWPTCARCSSAPRGPRPAPRHVLPPVRPGTALIAREMGVLVTDPRGALRAPLDVDADVAWVGYANEAIRARSSRSCRRPFADAACSPEAHPPHRPGEGLTWRRRGRRRSGAGS